LFDQLLPPLSHIASVLNGKRYASTAKNANKSSRIASLNSGTNGAPISHENEEPIKGLEFAESFNSALNSVNEIFCDKSSRKLIVDELINSNLSHENCMRRKFAKIYIKKFFIEERRPLQWLVSHCSHWSFDDNKHCK